MSRLLAQDVQAAEVRADFDRLYLDYSKAVYRRCLGMLRDREDAAEATQDVFLRASDGLADMDNAGAWLMTVARNVCLDRIRYRRRHPSESLDGTTGDSAADPEAAAIARVFLAAVLEHLSPRERDALWRRLFADESVGDIARELRVSYGAASQLLFRARQRAQKAARQLGCFCLLPLTVLRRRGLRRIARSVRASTSPYEAALSPVAGLALIGAIGAGLAGGAPASTGAGTAMRQPSPAAALARASTSAIPGASPLGVATGARPRLLPGGEAGPAPGLPSGILLPAPAGPDDGYFPWLAVSPGYSQDHTVYASGTQYRGCLAYCPQILLRTADAGATWHQARALGFLGGMIWLSPNFATDRRIVSYSGNELSVSSDGGETFGPPIAAAGQPRFLPDASGLLVLGSSPVVMGFDGTARPALAPLSGLTPGGTAPVFQDAVFISPREFIGLTGDLPGSTPTASEAIVECALGGGCQSLWRGPSSWTQLRLAPRPASPPALFAIGSSVAVSRDLGRTFSTLFAGTAIAFSPRPDFATSDSVVLASDSATSGAATTWYQVDGAGAVSKAWTSPWMIESAVLLPDGRMLGDAVSVKAYGSAGLRCSTDHGTTWSAAC